MEDYFLGNRQLGEWLDVVLQCKDIDGTPSMPVEPPFLTIWNSSGTSEYAREMPVSEKEGVSIGLFVAKVFLGSGFSMGEHGLQIAFTVGSDSFLAHRTFRITEGGSARGIALGAYFYRRPNANHVVYQVESGSVLKGTNPKVN